MCEKTKNKTKKNGGRQGCVLNPGHHLLTEQLWFIYYDSETGLVD
jgi:hypothetical protein